MSETDFSKTLRKRLGKPTEQPKQTGESIEPIDSEKVEWIFQNHAPKIRTAIHMLEKISMVEREAPEWKAKFYPEPSKETKEYELEGLTTFFQDTVDEIRDEFAKEFQCSKDLALKYVFMAIKQKQKALNLSLN